jgi:prolyl-tRNA synthetase
MRLSSGFIPTVKETPAEAAIPSHQLMIRAGMIRPLSAGIYSFLPLGYRVVKKVADIIRQEMDAIGGQEFHLPALNPIELWEATGRVQAFGDNLFHVKNRPLVLAPTHEEVMGLIAKNHLSSYRELPQIWYQIQTKFRNEPRPRSGVLRGRQFIMKDSYSFDASWEGLDRSYDLHAEAYRKIFTRCGLKFFVVGASSGAMGGTGSQEFMLESDAGEDVIAVSAGGSYAANLEIATSRVPPLPATGTAGSVEPVHTPNVRTIQEVSGFLAIPPDRLAKSLAYWAGDQPILAVLAGTDELNESKLSMVAGADVRPMEPEQVAALAGAEVGFIGPVNLRGFRILADVRLKGASGLVSGGNRTDYHIRNIDLARDARIDGYHDLRSVREGEEAPDGSGPLRIVKGIELGHIFKLGTKYSDALGATFLDEKGAAHAIIMGSYGIGLERIVACHIEQNHDEKGITWDRSIAPFLVHLIAFGAKNPAVFEEADSLYAELQESGVETLFDDRRDLSPGVKFNDADLLGMPLQLIVSEKNLAKGQIEVKARRSGERSFVARAEIHAFVRDFRP